MRLVPAAGVVARAVGREPGAGRPLLGGSGGVRRRGGRGSRCRRQAVQAEKTGEDGEHEARAGPPRRAPDRALFSAHGAMLASPDRPVRCFPVPVRVTPDTSSSGTPGGARGRGSVPRRPEPGPRLHRPGPPGGRRRRGPAPAHPRTGHAGAAPSRVPCGAAPGRPGRIRGSAPPSAGRRRWGRRRTRGGSCGTPRRRRRPGGTRRRWRPGPRRRSRSRPAPVRPAR